MPSPYGLGICRRFIRQCWSMPSCIVCSMHASFSVRSCSGGLSPTARRECAAMELHSRVCSSPRFRLDGGGRRHSDYDGREAAARRWRYSRKLPVPSSTEVSPPSPWRTFMLPRASPINMLSHPCKEGKSVRQRPPAFTRFPNSRGGGSLRSMHAKV